MLGQPSMPRGMVFALALVLALNYVDRSSLATAAPLLQQEFNLTSSQLGLLLSAFFWVYTPAQLLGGWLVHRFDVRLVLALGVLLWGAATALTGIANGFAMVFVLRLLLGLGECVAFPSIQLLVTRLAPLEERGRVSSLISSGQGFGPMLGTLFGGLAMAAFGWRAMFIGLGAITMLWLWPWFSAAYGKAASHSPHAPSRPAHDDANAVSYLRILRHRDFWGAALGQFSLNFTFYFAFIWMPSYLVQAGGFPVTDMASIVAAIYGVYALVTAFCGKFADRQVARGASATRVWKGIVFLSAFGLALTMTGCALLEPHLAVWLLGLSAFFFGLGTPALYTVTATLPGPRAAGRWAGAQNMVGQFAGVLSPMVTGMLIDRTGNYNAAFLVAAAAALVSLLGWCVIVRRVEAVSWDAGAPIASPVSA